MSKKWVLQYETPPEGLAKVKELFPAHKQRLDEFHARGVLILVGPLGNPPVGALGVFTTKEAAEEFMAGDPFVLNGAVVPHPILEWNEAYS
ncbi:MAG TPA: YciI family protein [Polyangiaceae bacterium]